MLKLALAFVGLASIASMVACGGSASDDVGFTTGSAEGALLAGTRLSESQVATYVRAAGFAESEVGTMVCIAKYESNYYEKASHQNSNGSTDYGLFQINSVNLGSGKCASTGTQAYDPTINAKCARDIYQEQGVKAWYAYTSHKTECESFPAPASGSTTTTMPSSGSSTTVPSSSGGSTSGSGSSVGSDAGTTTATGSSSGDDSTGDDDSFSTGSTTTTSGDDAGTSTTTTTSGSSTDSSSDCWSQTLGEYVQQGTCVNSVFDDADEQCYAGVWYGNVSNGSGPWGTCTEQD